MSLKNFLDFRNNCPICNSKLCVYFSSQKKQQHFLENNCYTIKTPLYSINHRRKYSVSYTFDLNEDVFWIDFYTKDNQKMENLFPKFLLRKFKELDENTQPHRFYKMCKGCYRYNYQSSLFTLDLENSKIAQPINVQTEYLGVAHKINSGYNLFRIVNQFISSESFIEYGRSDSTESLRSDSYQLQTNSSPTYSSIKLPLIPFSSAEETASRLNKLMIFS